MMIYLCLYINYVTVQMSFLQGDTIENVSNELEDIMENGNYFIGASRNLFILRYQPRVAFKKSPRLSMRITTHNDDPRSDTKMQLHKAEIDNFVQKLGFRDDDEDLVKKFRHITNVSFSMMYMYYIKSCTYIQVSWYCWLVTKHESQCVEFVT